MGGYDESERRDGSGGVAETGDAVGLGSDLGSGISGLGGGTIETNADLGGARNLQVEAGSGDPADQASAVSRSEPSDSVRFHTYDDGSSGADASGGERSGPDDAPGTAGGGGTYYGPGTTGFGAGDGTTGTGGGTAGLGSNSDIGGGTTSPGGGGSATTGQST